jgi:hypothetical protein
MIEIILLCRNRLIFAEEALRSLCEINYNNYKITISDNSNNPLFENRDFKSEYPNNSINYIYRNANLDASDHFEKVILECTGEFICLFHDDDIALPNFIQNRIKFFEDKNTVAIGTNAYDCINQKRKKTTLFPFAEIIKIKSSYDLITYYFSINYGRVAPFPGYIYRREALVKSVKALKSPAKKYSDVVLLSELLQYGTIIWHPNPTMYYRRHLNNDSNFENIKDRLGLLGFIKAIDKEKIVDYYRFMFYFKWLPRTNYYKDRIKSVNHYKKPIKKFLLFFLIKNFYAIVNKYLRKE